MSITVALLVAAALPSGCSSGNDDAATRTAERLHATLQQEDGAAACDLLSDDAQEQLTESGDLCETAVMDAGLPDTGRVVEVKVYGTAAQVRYDDDVVFLGEFPDGWKVTAAGCSAKAGAPYDCQVQGG
ncbi:hypothetical protein ASE12_03835 [Aeromicrobium sp. Root236]|uniref:hypothetical protein n=1 Tax=Aeromicrobium sp. Root236 TaxID=1736498 RepID=UPI0006F2B5B4|nr:hypothetical protein [Aeromicrobium sp. Root236]KRC63968.1 hypothetical protein ASE12_03835 [Aeromicrobium sp. Root236]